MLKLKEFPASSCHEITVTKSATNEGIEHLSIAEFPRITYSLLTSDSYCCCTTANISLLPVNIIGKGGLEGYNLEV